MRLKHISLVVLAMFMSLSVSAQTVNPTATYVDDNGIETETSSDFVGQAPLNVSFRANPSDVDDYTPTYEWHFRYEGEEKDFMVRYEENTDYTFNKAGSTYVTLYFRLDSALDPVTTTIKVTVSESKLVMPNAFSPNGDQWNEEYKPLEYQSLVEFHAYIFNRWGQKLYDWTDPAKGWDGTYNGKPVKEGVYFVLVKARGADGIVYNIRKDVNLLRSNTTNEK